MGTSTPRASHSINQVRAFLKQFNIVDQLHSTRFLKREVLPVLEKSHEIKMVKQSRSSAVDDMVKVKRERESGVEFVWQVVDPNDIPPRPLPKLAKEVVGKEVGVNVDCQHLNRRRQNARVGKITRDVEAMKEIRRQQARQLKT